LGDGGATPISAVPGNQWPVLPSAADSLVGAVLGQITHTQWWPPELLLTHQRRQLRELLAHARATVPFYAERFKGIDLLGGELDIEAFHRIPILTRADLQRNARSLLSTKFPKSHGTVTKIQSSGSTGQPVSVTQSTISTLFHRAFNLRLHLWNERDSMGKAAAIVVLSDPVLARTVPRDGASSWASGFRSGPMVYFDVQNPVSEQLRWLIETDPEYLLTYPTVLRALLLLTRDFAIVPSKLRDVTVMGEVVDPDLARLCRRTWGVPVTAALYVEIVNQDGEQCAPGETGRVVVTDLHNFAMPLIRYDVGDYAEPGNGCSCGRGLPTLARIVGRRRNMFVLPSGERFWPSAFKAGDLLDIAPVRQVQLVQRSTTRVEVRLVVDQALEPQTEDRIRDHLGKTLGHPFEFDLVYPISIPRSAGGKYEDCMSDVAAGSSSPD